MKISFCVGRSAPPDSTSETVGSRFSSAIWDARKLFFTVHGFADRTTPATVGHLKLAAPSAQAPDEPQAAEQAGDAEGQQPPT